MIKECFPEKFEAAYGTKAKDIAKNLPLFKDYQSWYSEAMVLVRQLLPDRLAGFVSHYEKPRSRKELSYESYRIGDYLQGLSATRGFEKKRWSDQTPQFSISSSSWP